MSKRPSVFSKDAVTAPAKKAKPTAAAVLTPRGPVAGEADMFRTSLYLSRSAHDKLREIAFSERKKVHQLFMEGIDKVLAARGFPSTADLK